MSDFNIYNGTLKKYVGTDTDVVVPDGITEIGSDAFSWSGVTSVVIPEGVTAIGSGAFTWCKALTSITLPNSMTDIGGGAFGDCDRLTDIYFTGTQAEWNSITKDSKWEPDSSYTVHYNYTPET